MEKEKVCDESRMEEWTFENADMSDAVMHRAKNYVDNWDEMKRNHIGCLFWGPVGTGKSYVAVCIANELLKQEVTVRLELSEVRQGTYVAGRNRGNGRWKMYLAATRCASVLFGQIRYNEAPEIQVSFRR